MSKTLKYEVNNKKVWLLKTVFIGDMHSPFSFSSSIVLRIVFPNEFAETIDETCYFIRLVLVLV